VNKIEATAIANERLDRLRSEPYANLAAQVGRHPVTGQVSR
jgi:hypothetical protein